MQKYGIILSRAEFLQDIPTYLKPHPFLLHYVNNNVVVIVICLDSTLGCCV